MNPKAPRLYGAPKIHKPNVPIRPVVSFCDSPSEKLAKFLNSEINRLTNFTAKDSVKNSSDFIESSRSVNIPDTAILVSFDIVNLFTSIPPKVCLKLLSRILTKSYIDVLIKNEMLSLVELCLNQNYFLFDGKFYEGQEGLAMGAPLSGKCADLFMHYFYQEFVEDPLNPFKQLIVYWKRYVDDIFCVWRGNTSDLQKFVDYLNTCYPGINFTFEIENAGVLNYLDLIVTRNRESLEFGIYRKPTNTDAVIPADSQHPWSHKAAAFHSFIHRLQTTPLNPSEYNKELRVIKHIAASNGYSSNLIDKLLQRKQHRTALSIIGSDNNKPPANPWRSIPYIGPLSERIGRILRRNGINVAFNTIHSLRSYISKYKDHVMIGAKSGVYVVQCGGCEKAYTGQTGRSFSKRASEHTSRTDSRFYMHLISENHVNEEHKVALLHQINKGAKMNFLEALEITRQIYDIGDDSLNERKEGGGMSILAQPLVTAPRPAVRLMTLSSIVKKK